MISKVSYIHLLCNLRISSGNTFFLTTLSKTDKNKIPEPRGYRAGEISETEPHASPKFPRSAQCLSARMSTGKLYDAFRSYLNDFDDEVGEHFLLNSVVCIFIFENSTVDRT